MRAWQLGAFRLDNRVDHDRISDRACPLPNHLLGQLFHSIVIINQAIMMIAIGTAGY